jgi:isopentenyldiphosphate isomerase
MNEADEKLDLVNENDQVIGGITRGEIKTLFSTTGKYVRYANCFVQNSKGQLWIPRRPAHKKIAPNGLDFSASEHVQAGESYQQAAVRGLDEELNLYLKIEELISVGKLVPDQSRPYFSSIFIVKQDTVPDFNKDDFTGYQWLTVDELKTLLDSGEVAKTDLDPAVNLL